MMSFWEPPPLEMFRANPARNGFYPTRGVNKPRRIKWRFRTLGEVISSPAVVLGSTRTIFFGSWDGRVYAADADTGRLKWYFRTDGPIVSSPAVDSSTVFVGSYDHYIYALDLETGFEQWRFRTRNSIASSPLVTRLFLPAEEPSSAPVCESLWVTVGSIDGRLYILNPKGIEMASFDTGHPVVSSPAGPVSGDPASLLPESSAPAIVTVGSGDGSLHAIDVKTGDPKWVYRAGASVDTSPAAAFGAFIFGSSDKCVYAVDAATGLERWRFRTGAPVRSSPAVFEETVFVGSSDRRLYALDVKRGTEKWKFSTRGPLESSPAVAEGTVYVGSNDGWLHAVDMETGKERWRFPTGAPIRSSPVIAAGVIYFGSDDGYLYALT
jgi:outer membrane protein assembly factor BamB